MTTQMRFLLFLGALPVSAAVEAETGVRMNLVDEMVWGRRSAKSQSGKRHMARPRSDVPHRSR